MTTFKTLIFTEQLEVTEAAKEQVALIAYYRNVNIWWGRVRGWFQIGYDFSLIFSLGNIFCWSKPCSFSTQVQMQYYNWEKGGVCSGFWLFCGAFFALLFFVCWLLVLIFFFFFCLFIFKLGEKAENFKNPAVCIQKREIQNVLQAYLKKLKSFSIHFPGDTTLSLKSMFAIILLRFPEML